MLKISNNQITKESLAKTSLSNTKDPKKKKNTQLENVTCESQVVTYVSHEKNPDHRQL